GGGVNVRYDWSTLLWSVVCRSCGESFTFFEGINLFVPLSNKKGKNGLLKVRRKYMNRVFNENHRVTCPACGDSQSVYVMFNEDEHRYVTNRADLASDVRELKEQLRTIEEQLKMARDRLSRLPKPK